MSVQPDPKVQQVGIDDVPAILASLEEAGIVLASRGIPFHRRVPVTGTLASCTTHFHDRFNILEQLFVVRERIK
jgi:hypothetical protein